MKKLDFITTKEIDSDECELQYNDSTPEEIVKFTLTKEYNIDNIISDYVKIINDFEFEDTLEMTVDMHSRKKTMQILKSGLVVAKKGMCGASNLLFISKSNYDKYLFEDMRKYIDMNYKIFLNDDVEDIILGRKTEEIQSGIILITNNDLYNVTTIGNDPTIQFMKVKLV